ncbi:MAG: sortase [bacterium]|nr:sortase [bacterium]
MKLSTKTIGNSLIAFSALGFLLLSLPFILPRLPQQTKPIGNAYAISIPKINATSPIVVGVDPWNPTEYRNALHLGVAQAKGTALPGQKGMIYLFAHSSGSPWEILRTNLPFLRLGELTKGDMVMLFSHGKEYPYVVASKKIVSPTDVSYLAKNSNNELILQTCWPPGTDWKRLLVFAKPS